MAGVQTAARRLLTEAAAAATYLTQAAFTAQKGAANGLATLGADGKLAAAQTPALTLATPAKATAGGLTYWKSAEGVLFLTGSTSSTASGATLATLPPGYRPAANQFMPVTVSSTTTAANGYLVIAPTGALSVMFNSSIGAQSWIVSGAVPL